MNIIFFGSSKYSTIVAEMIQKKLGLAAIVTLNDSPQGRKKIITPNPVKAYALTQNIPNLTADKLDKNIIEKIASYNPDFLIIADYGLLLPKNLLKLPKYTALNIHHSLLPKYRGPSPAQNTIISGEKISGVTIIEVNDKIDSGPILAQQEYELNPNETTESLLINLNTIGGSLALKVIDDFINNKVIKKNQDESKATYTQKIKKIDGFIDINNPPNKEQLDKIIRAYYPWPTVWTKIETEKDKWKIIKFLPEEKIQIEGGKAMKIKDFLNGYQQLKQKINAVLN